MYLRNPTYLPIKESIDILDPWRWPVKESVDILGVLYKNDATLWFCSPTCCVSLCTSPIRQPVAWRTLSFIRQAVAFRNTSACGATYVVNATTRGVLHWCPRSAWNQYASQTNLGITWIARESIKTKIESARNSMGFGSIRQATALEGYGGALSLKKMILLDFDFISLFQQAVRG